jgi:hypothetical protein
MPTSAIGTYTINAVSGVIKDMVIKPVSLIKMPIITARFLPILTASKLAGINAIKPNVREKIIPKPAAPGEKRNTLKAYVVYHVSRAL